MREDVETLRRRLYRPDATPADLASYLQAAPTGAEPAETAVPAGPTPAESATPAEPAGPVPDGAAPAAPAPSAPGRRGRIVAGAAGAAVVLALGGLLLTARQLQPEPAPTPTAPVVATAAPRAPDDSMVVLATVVDGGAQAHATGEAREVGPERYRYDVAAGDTVAGVAARFGLCGSEVVAGIPDGGRWPVVEPGEVLLLERHRDVVLADGWAGC